jgi:hypothetical protein
MATFSVTARLDRTEREAVEAVIASINVGIPVDPDLDEKAQRNDASCKLRRALGALVGGDECSAATFERAMSALQQQIDVCRTESDVEHWLAQLPEAERTGDPTVPTSAAHMAHRLSEARAVQLREAERAFDIVAGVACEIDCAARRLAPADAICV